MFCTEKFVILQKASAIKKQLFWKEAPQKKLAAL